MSINLNFEDTFKIATLSLHINRAHPSVKRDIVWMLQFSVYFTLTLWCFVVLSYSIFIHDIQAGKFSEACKNFDIVIVTVTVSLKYFVLVRHQESFISLINVLEKDFVTAKGLSKEDQLIVLHYAKKGDRACKYWLIFGFGTSLIFPIEAFVRMGYSYWKGEFQMVPMFDLTYPPAIEAYKDEPTIFVILFLINCAFGLYASTIYMGFDTLVLIFMIHVCGQLELLSLRMGKLFSDDNKSQQVDEELKYIVTKLQSLYEFMDYVKRNFAWLYEYIMKATTFLLPLTAFMVLDGLRNKQANVQFISFFIGCIIHFYLPSYYSDLLMDASERFRQAIYSSGWEKCPDKRVRQTILFMLTRARIPMGIKTIFYEINLDTFAEMCRQSYTILNLMNAAWG